MEIDQLETFLAVGTYGGFHRAAAALSISQPAVSARIRALENSLGVKLFARVGGTLSVSAAGKALRPHAEQLLRDVSRARQAVHELQPSARGTLSVAAALSVCIRPRIPR
jgi:LysR family transcriptional regulator, cyn operon transcriptional activator